ncbi:unnamed protein product (macronuclear) [Paramecium tetraurelia]|uniref:Leucine Rich Repeat family protein n=1 Tax=Paramecium tetraurelia TaxID=5888 RepID=A0CQP9_PARTE|nr:uncharacterized protein GSPATT00009464001 [Paramecium tetraurelia]CAK73116.1 unnamed protein product [Paramecium tetraurelia]|eukprot:XP_001440513.1 hypothetical protein (macronuclear) [Paramecium tetraurelia strain d4-2]
MKLNISGTSINTKSSLNTKLEQNAKNLKQNEDNLFFDLTEFQISDSNTPLSIQLKESNSTNSQLTKHFFPSKPVLSENKLPPLNSRYHLVPEISREQIIKKKLFKENYSVLSFPSAQSLFSSKSQSIDYQKLGQQIVNTPNSQDYYKFYKHSNKCLDAQSYNETPNNIYVNLNKAMQDQQCMPRKMQIIDNLNKKEISVAGQLSSHQYIKLFAAGLGSSTFHQLERLNVSSNNLDNEDLEIILDQLPKSVQSVDLKNNKISKNGCLFLQKLLMRQHQFVIELNLENNLIGDQGLKYLIDSLQNNKCLRILNLSQNQIQDQVMEPFGRMMKKNNIIQELYLHYNKITFKGGIFFFKGLCKNSVLKVLDISFNKLGGNKDCTNEICNFIARPHPELIHLDLSHNDFKDSDSQKIANELEFNKIIYGFHFEGNSNYQINHQGYLREQKNKKLVTESQYDDINIEELDKKHLELQMQQMEQQTQKKKNEFIRIQSVDIVNLQLESCWICQGWLEVMFQWKPHKSGFLDEDPIFIHLEFEDYQPSNMQKTNDGYFTLYRMCPPNQTIRYFFSNPVQNVQVYAKDQRTIQTQTHSQLRNFGVQMEYSNGKVLQSQPLHTVNMMQTSQSTPIFDKKKHYLANIQCKPRVPEKIVEFDVELAKKRKWTLDNSIFKDFDEDTEAHLEQCLEADLENSKVLKHLINTNEVNSLKDQLKKYYKYIISCYKYLASQQCEQDFPRINIQTIQGFYSQSKNNQLIKQVDWEICLISTIVIKELKSQYIQERALVRHQFLELLIRLAKETYAKQGNCSSISQGFDKMMQAQNGQFGFILDYGYAQQWRDERYWTQIMDMTIRFKLPFLKIIIFLYFKISRINHMLRKNLFLFKILGCYSKIQIQLYFIYLQSIMMQVDEITQKRHFEMQFIEFIEALARVAESISPNSNNYQIKQLNAKQRRTLPLYIKFEGLLYVMFYRIKRFDVDINVIEKSVIKSHEIKRLGIFIEDNYSSSSSGEEDNEVSNLRLSYTDPQNIINRMLFDDECKVSLKDTMSNQSSGKKRQNSLQRQDSITLKRSLLRRNTIQNQLQQIKIAEIENEMAEIAEYEESTPLNKLRIQNRKITRSKYDIVL